jgi:hypothetical protein
MKKIICIISILIISIYCVGCGNQTSEEPEITTLEANMNFEQSEAYDYIIYELFTDDVGFSYSKLLQTLLEAGFSEEASKGAIEELHYIEQDWIEEAKREVINMSDEDGEGFSEDAVLDILINEYGFTTDQAKEAIKQVKNGV